MKDFLQNLSWTISELETDFVDEPSEYNVFRVAYLRQCQILFSGAQFAEFDLSTLREYLVGHYGGLLAQVANERNALFLRDAISECESMIELAAEMARGDAHG